MKMKRFFVYFLLMLVLIPVGICESVDVESLSDSELESVMLSIQKEMVSRGIVRELEEGEYVLHTGEYIVGKDIAPGRYILSPIGGVRYSITIEEYEGAEDEYNNLYEEYSLDLTRYEAGVINEPPVCPESDEYYFSDYLIGDPMTIELLDGQVLHSDAIYYYDWQKVTIKKSTGLFMDE